MTGGGAKKPSVEHWVDPSARPPRHTPPPPKDMAEQRREHDERSRKSWTTGREDAWTVRTAAPIGSRSDLMEGIFQAIMSKFRWDHPGSAADSMPSSWLKERIDEYDLASLDQEIRSFVRERFEQAGVRISR